MINIIIQNIVSFFFFLFGLFIIIITIVIIIVIFSCALPSLGPGGEQEHFCVCPSVSVCVPRRLSCLQIDDAKPYQSARMTSAISMSKAIRKARHCTLRCRRRRALMHGLRRRVVVAASSRSRSRRAASLSLSPSSSSLDINKSTLATHVRTSGFQDEGSHLLLFRPCSWDGWNRRHNGL